MKEFIEVIELIYKIIQDAQEHGKEGAEITMDLHDDTSIILRILRTHGYLPAYSDGTLYILWK